MDFLICQIIRQKHNRIIKRVLLRMNLIEIEVIGFCAVRGKMFPGSITSKINELKGC